MIRPLFMVANGCRPWPNNTWALNRHFQFSLSARLHWRTRPTPGSYQCTILDHSRHLMEIGEPSRMVRRQLWSPSYVCQCGRWVARTSWWLSFKQLASVNSTVTACPLHVFTPFPGGLLLWRAVCRPGLSILAVPSFAGVMLFDKRECTSKAAHTHLSWVKTEFRHNTAQGRRNTTRNNSLPVLHTSPAS